MLVEKNQIIESYEKQLKEMTQSLDSIRRDLKVTQGIRDDLEMALTKSQARLYSSEREPASEKVA